MKTYKILILLIFCSFICGCDEELDLSNPNSQTAAGFWLNEQHAVEGINAVYNSLIVDGNYNRMTPVFADARADDFQADTPWTDLAKVANFTVEPTAGPVHWSWSAYYQQVFRANQVLENVPNIQMNEQLRTRILGQAYFLRGLAFFNLAINFEKVPLILSIPKIEEEYYPATSSEEDLWSQIISDFKSAEEMLPISYKNVSGPDKDQLGRVTKGAAIGFLGKTYLYQKRWDLASKEFKKLIEGTNAVYSLINNYRDNFSEFSENNSESIFEVQFANLQQVGGTVFNYGGEPSSSWKQITILGHTYAMDGFGFSDFLPTRWIYEEYKKEMTVDGGLDPRLFATIASYEPSANSTTVYGGVPWPHAENAIYPRKYTHDGLAGFTEESPGSIGNNGINYRVMRYADILLMYAEALNELGQTDDAYDYIQEIRNRANLPDLRTLKPEMNQSEMRDQLAHERALEFAIEGLRIHDIIRWGWFYDTHKLAELKSRDAEYGFWSPGKEYLPIPQVELDVNPNLKPNSAN